MSTSCSRKPDRSKGEFCQATILRRQRILAAAFSFADAAWRSLRGSRACGKTCGQQGDSVLPIWKS
jgi:hypothetical protein